MCNKRQVQKPSRRRESIHGTRPDGLILNPEGLAVGAAVRGAAANTRVIVGLKRSPHVSRFHDGGA